MRFWNCPSTREAGNLADRFVTHMDSYFRFITTPDVEPTNNLAEQAIRFVAIHRRMTQGTRRATGQHWCERIWTVIATCGQQSRSVFSFLCQAVEAYFQGARARASCRTALDRCPGRRPAAAPFQSASSNDLVVWLPSYNASGSAHRARPVNGNRKA